MASVFQTYFSEYPDGTLLKDVAGWTVYGQFSANVNAARITGAQLVLDATDGTVMSYNTSSTSMYSEVRMKYQFAGTNRDGGPAVRTESSLDWVSIRLGGASSVSILSSNNGSRAILATYSVPVVIGDIVRLEVDGENNTVELFVNGVSAGSPVDISSVSDNTSTNAGMYGKTSDPFIDDLDLGTTASDLITLANEPSRKVYATFGPTYNYTISGTYEGVTTPTVIEYRVEEFVSGTVVTDWTTLDAAPTGGTFSGAVDIPRGPYYKILVRYSNATNIQSSSLRIGFGLVIELAGQSNTDNIWNSTLTATPIDDVVKFNGSEYQQPTDRGCIYAGLNAISQSLGCVVAAYETAVGATAIEQHLIGGDNYANRQAALIAAGGKLNGFWWGQGESNTGTTQATYETRLSELRADILSRTGQTSDTLPMFIVQLGRNVGGSGSESGWDGVRSAQTKYANETSDVYISHQSMDLPMDDGLHRTSQGYVTEVLRFSDSFLAAFNGAGNSGRGPIPTSATYSGSDVTITHNLNGSTGLTVPALATSLYELTNDDFSTTTNPTSISYVAPDKIVLTFASIPTGTVKLRSHQGQDLDETTFPTGDELHNSQAVMVEPITIETTVTEGVPPVTVDITLDIGAPDGTYKTYLMDVDDNEVFSGNVAYSGGSATITGLSVAAGTLLRGYVDSGNTLESEGCGIKGVTV
ncbi:hypothetical protein JC525_08915 [Alteromonas sp. IB21]|uniref:sialate O-acetylesterase n=1 Tax=Alteromonas sp. IB21 TaxID=2779369 RepID=UPI0018E8045C|nr:sialate O-acetylesterase [Alteromonas sp. IB21]MBJ2129056.1 hypothetical protein [Alteromonas sp. IB21]